MIHVHCAHDLRPNRYAYSMSGNVSCPWLLLNWQTSETNAKFNQSIVFSSFCTYTVYTNIYTIISWFLCDCVMIWMCVCVCVAFFLLLINGFILHAVFAMSIDVVKCKMLNDISWRNLSPIAKRTRRILLPPMSFAKSNDAFIIWCGGVYFMFAVKYVIYCKSWAMQSQCIR